MLVLDTDPVWCTDRGVSLIVGNGICASTCAMFSTLMHERHDTKTVVFGGKVRDEYVGDPMRLFTFSS
jgi:hypothetical protein